MQPSASRLTRRPELPRRRYSMTSSFLPRVAIRAPAAGHLLSALAVDDDATAARAAVGGSGITWIDRTTRMKIAISTPQHRWRTRDARLSSPDPRSTSDRRLRTEAGLTHRRRPVRRHLGTPRAAQTRP